MVARRQSARLGHRPLLVGHAALRFGNYRIGLMDVATRQIRQLAGFNTGRNTNPEFTADGRALFFIATPDGIPNVYRTELATGNTTRITNVLSGVSGITPLTPALSVAANAPTVVFTVFEDDNYNLYAMTDKDTGTSAATALNAQDAAILPPLTRRQNEVDVLTLLQTPTAGLPPPRRTIRTRSTRRSWGSTWWRSRPSASASIAGVPTRPAASRFSGATCSATTSSAPPLQLTNRFEDIGGAVMYLNRTHRWNWGLIGEQTPYASPQFQQGFTIDPNFGPAFVQQELPHHVRSTARSPASLQYPFSRAQRVEFSGGVRRISFSQELRSTFFYPHSPASFSADERGAADALIRSISARQRARSSTTRRCSARPARSSASATDSRYHAVDRVAQVLGRAGRLPEVLHGPAVYAGAPRHALRPLRPRQRRRPAVAAVPRLLGPDPRI